MDNPETTAPKDRFWRGFWLGCFAVTVGQVLLPFWWPAAGLFGQCIR